MAYKLVVCAILAAFVAVQARPTPENGIPFECEGCKLAVAQAEKMLEANSTISFIDGKIESLCDKMGDQAQMCKFAAQAALSYGIQYLETTMTPEAACTAVKACDSDSTYALSTEAKATLISANDNECMYCTFAVQALDAALANNDTLAKILEDADKICADIPGFLESECDALVAEYGPQIVNLLVQYLSDATSICQELGMCPKQFNKLQAAVNAVKAAQKISKKAIV